MNVIEPETLSVAVVERPARPVAEGREFIVMITAMMATGAMAIDVMLPVFPDIRAEFGMPADSSQVTWIITAFFLGLAVGPWLYGPVSDRYGRRRPLFVGLCLYIAAAALATVAPSFGWIVASRFLWGLGSAAPRTLSLAIIRDRYDGDVMARLMSMILAVFLLVPILAPSLGAALNAIAPWRIVFWAPAVATAGLLVWAYFRLPETLTPERQRPFTRRALLDALKVVVADRQIRSLTVAMTFLMGMMTGYLTSSELILEDVYSYGDYFPLFFGGVAIMLALSALNNARLVNRLGLTGLLRRMSSIALGAAYLQLVIVLVTGGRPPFILFTLAVVAVIPIGQGLIPNANTAAMLPVPHIAGTATAIIGTITVAGGALLGNLVGAAFDGTVRPFAMLTAVFVTIAVGLIYHATRSTEPRSVVRS